MKLSGMVTDSQVAGANHFPDIDKGNLTSKGGSNKIAGKHVPPLEMQLPPTNRYKNSFLPFDRQRKKRVWEKDSAMIKHDSCFQ
jgi:hypothetical protein